MFSKTSFRKEISQFGIFSVTQTAYQSGAILMMAVSILAAQTILSQKEFASVPLSIAIFGTFLGFFPASQFMKHFGRRSGLLLGTGLGILGVLLMLIGLYQKSMILYSSGHFFYGIHQSFLLYLRFVAMESVDDSEKSNALSWILLAGIPAAFLGPALGLFGKTLFSQTVFLGSFLFLFVFLLMQFFLILFFPKDSVPKHTLSKQTSAEIPPRSFGFHISNGNLWLSILSSSLSFGLMVMLMSAVPVAMQTHGHEMHHSTLVLQMHVLGMYLPSFFSGKLVKMLGPEKLILSGVLIMFLEMFTAIQGIDFKTFSIALVLLGIGWNFLYVGGTNLLVQQYLPSEKNTIQAINDSTIYLFGTIATYNSAYLERLIGWMNLNLTSIPFLVILAILSSYAIIKKQKSYSLN